jgi:hypothetical protein
VVEDMFSGDLVLSVSGCRWRLRWSHHRKYLSLLPSWSPAWFESCRRGFGNFQRRRPLFGSESSLSFIRIKDILLLSENKLSRLVFELDSPSPTLFQAGSTQTYTGQSSWYHSSVFWVNPTSVASDPVQPTSSWFSWL